SEFRETIEKVTPVPLYAERYNLITAAGSPLSDRDNVNWREIGDLRLCLLTADMQNSRIINRHLTEAGATAHPTLES
ncbi:LysR family transcriptional regulator, partial [Rhizobium johnstonii]